MSAGTRIQERRLKPLFRWLRFVPEKTLHDIEATHAGSSFQVQTSTAFCKVRSSLRAAIRKCSENRALPITSGDLVIDLCAVIEKQLQQRILDTSAKRMHAGRYQTERRRASAIHVRLGIDLRTTFQQYFGDLDDVRGSLLSISLDSICRNVMKQCCSVLACRSGVDQSRIVAQESFQRLAVALDNCAGGFLEARHRGTLVVQAVQVF